MPTEAMLPCLVCNKRLPAVIEGSDNQPYGGTEFTTYGHYGSTFWDNFYGEQLVLTICDDCLRERSDRLGQQKRFLPVRCEGMQGFGRQWVDRPMVAYTGNADDGEICLEPEELGTKLPQVEWVDDIEQRKAALLGEVE
jgi:hypothetical protein